MVDEPVAAAGAVVACFAPSSWLSRCRVVGDELGGCACRGVERVVPGREADVVALELQGACEVDGVVTAQGVLRRRTSLVPVDAGQTGALLLARSGYRAVLQLRFCFRGSA